jgi:hypothetical protein
MSCHSDRNWRRGHCVVTMRKKLMRFLLSACAVFALSLVASADDAKNPAKPGPCNPCLVKPGTGVEGSVNRGPIQPVGKPGQKNTAPVANAVVKALDANGKEVARTKTDKDGYYELKLKPGKYTLVGPRGGIPPRNFKKDIEVLQRGWTRVDIKVDTGIRTPAVKPVAPKGVALPVVHKVDLSAKVLPATLTVKVGEEIVFTNSKVGGRLFVKWSAVADDDSNAVLIKQLPQRINPPILAGARAGKGELTVTTKPSARGPESTHTIKITVLK